MTQQNNQSSRVSIDLWDIPTRLTHWLFVCLIVLLWWTQENDTMDWHAWSGYALLTLLIFRLYWGIFGSSSTRFSSFVVGPRALLDYVRDMFQARTERPVLGHNPIGGWSVIAMLALMLTQVGLGLFSVDVDGIESGPLSYYVSFDLGRTIADIHEVLFNVLLAFVALHISAIVFYLVLKKKNLVTPMITGRAQLQAEDSPAAAQYPGFAPLWRSLVGLSLSAAITWLIISA